jgi:hypothetical protein
MQRYALAIINNGFIRREFLHHVVPNFRHEAGDGMLFEFPLAICSDKHPFSAKNRVWAMSQDMGFDRLIIIDGDTVPLVSLFNLLETGKNLAFMPYPLSTERGVRWSVEPASWVGCEQDTKWMEVDIAGVGCMAASKKALDALKAPFTPEFSKDGEIILSSTYAFSEKAHAAGLRLWATTAGVCEHYRVSPLLPTLGYYKKWVL